MTLKASDFTFCLYHKPDEEEGVAILMDAPGAEHGSDHLSEMVEPFWPVGIEMDEVVESTFLVSEQMTEQEVKDKLISAGFTFSQKWQDEVNSDD